MVLLFQPAEDCADLPLAVDWTLATQIISCSSHAGSKQERKLILGGFAISDSDDL